MERSRNRKLQRQKRSSFWSSFYAAVIYAIFYIPVFVMIQFSFNDAKRNYSWEGFTTAWYGKLFSFPFCSRSAFRRFAFRGGNNGCCFFLRFLQDRICNIINSCHESFS